MPNQQPTVLIIGYGNPGRRDDGLGPAAAAALEESAPPGVTIDSAYQLSVEDAAAVAEHDVTLFIDADATGPEPFTFRKLTPRAAIGFSTHSVQPDEVLGLAAELLDAARPGYLLAIRGYEFNEFGEGLSLRAAQNLDAALAFIQPVIVKRTFCEGAATAINVPAAVPANGDI